MEIELEKLRYIRDAWFTAPILTSLTGKEVDPFDLLPDWVWPKKVMTKEEKDKELEELKKELKVN